MRRRANTWTLYRKFFPEDTAEWMWVSARVGDTYFRLRTMGSDEWGYEAFDMGSDPGLTINIFDSNTSEHRDIARKLQEYKEVLEQRYKELAGANRPDDLSRREKLKELKALGYI